VESLGNGKLQASRNPGERGERRPDDDDAPISWVFENSKSRGRFSLENRDTERRGKNVGRGETSKNIQKQIQSEEELPVLTRSKVQILK